jgi:imidazolonepropionase-like amidohydrolase
VTARAADADARVVRLSAGSSLALQGATLFDADGEQRTDATIRIEGNRIAALNSSRSTGRSKEVLDLSGMWVIPGLIDAHIHIADRARAASSSGLAERRGEGLGLLQAGLACAQMVRQGVTTIRSLGGEPEEGARAIRQAISEGVFDGPRILTAGRAIVIGRVRERTDRNLEAIITARWNFGQLADLVMLGSCHSKARQRFSPVEIRDLTEEAHRRGLRATIRPTSMGEAIAATRSGVDTIEGIPEDANRRLISAMSERGTALVPLLSSSPPRGPRIEITRMALTAGVPLLAGSGWSPTHPERSLGRELAALSLAGIPWRETFRAVTVAAAHALGVDNEIGEISAGRLAELVIIKKDPRADPGALAAAQHIEKILVTDEMLTR